MAAIVSSKNVNVGIVSRIANATSKQEARITKLPLASIRNHILLRTNTIKVATAPEITLKPHPSMCSLFVPDSAEVLRARDTLTSCL
jgi:hypothetical protein